MDRTDPAVVQLQVLEMFKVSGLGFRVSVSGLGFLEVEVQGLGLLKTL